MIKVNVVVDVQLLIQIILSEFSSSSFSGSRVETTAAMGEMANKHASKCGVVNHLDALLA